MIFSPYLLFMICPSQIKKGINRTGHARIIDSGRRYTHQLLCRKVIGGLLVVVIIFSFNLTRLQKWWMWPAGTIWRVIEKMGLQIERDKIIT